MMNPPHSGVAIEVSKHQWNRWKKSTASKSRVHDFSYNVDAACDQAASGCLMDEHVW